MNRSAEIFKYKIRCAVLQRSFGMIIRFPSNEYLINHVFGFLFNALLTITTVVLNSVTLLTFCKSLPLRNKVSNFLIMSQSCIDLGVGAIANLLHTVTILSELRGDGNCQLKYVYEQATVMMTILSMTTLSAMNIERYFGIVHPLIHRNKVTRKKFLVYLILITLLVFIVFGISFVRPGITRIFGMAVIVLFLTSMAFVYIRIYFASVSSSRMVHTQVSQEQRKKKRQFLKDIKLAKTCFLVVACSLMCLLPTAIASGKSNFFSFDRVVVVIWTKSFAMLNPALNTVVFFWKNGMLRSQKNFNKYLQLFESFIFGIDKRVKENRQFKVKTSCGNHTFFPNQFEHCMLETNKKTLYLINLSLFLIELLLNI